MNQHEQQPKLTFVKTRVCDQLCAITKEFFAWRFYRETKRSTQKYAYIQGVTKLNEEIQGKF